jgi:SecD/SecF fusion protein
MKRFYWKIAICLLPIVVAGLVVARAYYQWAHGEGGFKLGVDLVGGTILVYEVEDASKLPENYKPEELAASLKRRIDPTDLYNVTIRPVSNTRVEIILPTGGAHQAQIREEMWQSLLDEVRQRWPALANADLDVGMGHRQELLIRAQQALDADAWNNLLAKVREKWPALKEEDLKKIPAGKTTELIDTIQKQKTGTPDAEVKAFVEDNYKSVPLQDIEAAINKGEAAGRKRDVTGEDVQRIKNLIAQVGSLEFRILANSTDDKEAIDQARKEIEAAKTDPQVKKDLETRALLGEPPPKPVFTNPETGEKTNFFTVTLPDGKTHQFSYSWVELGRGERRQLGLDNAAANEEARSAMWKQAAAAREKGETVPILNGCLLYSRVCQNRKIPDEERARRKIEYFVLARDPERDANGEPKAITGKYLTAAYPGLDRKMQPCVNFRFDTTGGDLFYEITSQNKPTGSQGSPFQRHLAIILDGQVVSAPVLNEPIRNDGQISGNFTQVEVNRLVSILRSGALPATLKQQPVSENTIGATLGGDTIRAGSLSVIAAFAAVLAFMIVYYRFAGLVASIALLANLLLTVAGMVALNATFTLPGLAGLVLMLGMAVDANVLIYERFREERDRGASIALAIRNGYDRSFPTIIDTHLSSIFTAIVLYAVGNDQLKGFGISLALGLVISLFTSLYMTRLIFDVWLYKGWLHKLSMLRFFSKPNIDFMRIRYYWFTATVILTVFGITVFLIRGDKGLNIDFVGGTAYTGELKEPIDITTLRGLLGEKNQEQALRVKDVKEGEDGHNYTITYADGTTQTVAFVNPPTVQAAQEREAEVKARASVLPDYSVEQLFLSTEPSTGGQSRYFTVRTTEKERDLVQVTLDRLLEDQAQNSLLKKVEITNFAVKGKEATLDFSDYASPGHVKTLLERQARAEGFKEDQPFEVFGEGKNKEGEYKEMRVALSSPSPAHLAKFGTILEGLKKEFSARPQPMRLENFDKQLAADTQQRAMYAIIASWTAILLYLWFRFGSWTFGAAAVACLVHDLFFTLGVIAFCHYIHQWFPGFATFLKIEDFKLDLPSVAALLTLVGYSVNDTIVVFDRIREVRGKNPALTFQMINDSVNQTLSRTILAAMATWLVVIVLYIFGGEGVHLFAFVMVVGVLVGTYSSIYIASPLLVVFGEGKVRPGTRERQARPEGVSV